MFDVASNNSFEDLGFYFKIIPNPANDFVNIHYELPFEDQLVVQLQNSIGEVVYLSNVIVSKKGFFKLDIADYQTGVYVLNLKTSSGVSSLKLIKN